MGKKEIQRSEWKRLYPVKKAILISIWLFLVFVIIAGIKYCLYNVIELGAVWTLILVTILVLLTLKPILNYVRTYYHCIPYFNKIFTKEELEALFENETFTDIAYLKENGMNKIDFAESEHWLRVNWRYLSKEMMVLGRAMPTASLKNRDTTPVWAMYLTGDIVEIDLGRKLSVEGRTKFGEYIWFNLDILPEEVLGKQEEEVSAIFREVYRNYVEEQAGISKKEVIKSLIRNAEIPRSICVYKMPSYLQRPMRDYSNGCNVYYR